MKITKNQIRNLIREALIREAEEADDGDAYAMWQKRRRENPHEHDNESYADYKKRTGQGPEVDKSSDAQQMVSDVLAFIEESNLGTPKQVGDANRYTVEPISGTEVDFHIMTRKSGLRLVVKVMGTRDFVPSGGNYDPEDLEFIAENMSKITDILNTLAGSGLPIHSFTVGTMG